MAQLIKLQDYISRYEWDVYRYPTQYIRVKKQNWNKLKVVWSSSSTSPAWDFEEEKVEEKSPSSLEKLKAFLGRKENRTEEVIKETKKENEGLPDTEDDLKLYFLDKLFDFQLKWATSTVNRISFVDQKYYEDPLLKFLLQRFPDTYLLMYFPVFQVKNAPMDAEALLISPIGIEILYFIEPEEDAVIMAGDERTWLVETDNEIKKVLNPHIALKRTEQIIRQFFQDDNVQFPIQKTILSRTNSIVFASEPYQTKIIDKNRFPTWFKDRRELISPLKNKQLKAAEVILKNCQSLSVPRPDWEDEIAFQTINDLEKM